MLTYDANKSKFQSSEDFDDSNQQWKVQLFNDSSKTRSYVSQTLVKVAGFPEDSSYSAMVQAHKNGCAVIGEYYHEQAEHYKEVLTASGLVCDIFPVEC